MRINLLIVLLFFSLSQAFGQKDSAAVKKIKYSNDFRFEDGLYLKFENFKTNSPVMKTRIVSTSDYSVPDFFDKAFENNKIQVFDDIGSIQEIKKSDVWGYCNNGVIFIYWNNEFNRINLIGALCHFMADVTIINRPYDPYNYSSSYYNYNQPNPTSSETRQYILNFETGQVLDYEAKSIEISLMSDPELYDEFNKLSKKKKKQMVFFYMRKFNERHPVFIMQH